MKGFFKDGVVMVGGKKVAFVQKEVRGGYLMYMPEFFAEDAAIVTNYSYFYSADKSPLSIAVKFSAATALADKSKLLESYFKEAPESAGESVHYRETVTQSQYMSVYCLRFSVEKDGGMLLGCFNCSAAYKDDWKPVVLEILKDISPADKQAL